MSTIGYENWAVDMADVTAIYPFQGSEFLMTILGIAFWLVWHFVQFKRENREFDGFSSAPLDKNAVNHAIDRY